MGGGVGREGEVAESQTYGRVTLLEVGRGDPCGCGVVVLLIIIMLCTVGEWVCGCGEEEGAWFAEEVDLVTRACRSFVGGAWGIGECGWGVRSGFCS